MNATESGTYDYLEPVRREHPGGGCSASEPGISDQWPMAFACMRVVSWARRRGRSHAISASSPSRRRRVLLRCTLAAVSCGMLSTFALRAQNRGYTWISDDDSENVSLWTSEMGRTSLGAVKVATRFGLPVAQLVNVLRDLVNYPHWYRDCARTQVLSGPDIAAPIVLDARGKLVPGSIHDAYRMFFLQHVAWLADRWAIIENQTRVLPDGSLLITFRSCDRCSFVAPEGTVRMALSGEWRLTPVDAQHTLVTYIVDLDMKSDMPNFLVRPKVKDAARGTILALGARALALQRGSRSEVSK